MDSFAGIIGQEKAVNVLRKALWSGNIHHANLFIGPGGIGKKTTAKAFARAIILQGDPLGEPYLREGVHPDFKNIERDEKKTQIGIEQINHEMEPWLALRPYRSSRRVVIINEAHHLSLPAANALLKTLEEPPAYAVIILVADDRIMLETIMSRCQNLSFGPISENDLGSFLMLRGLDRDRASRLARLAQGCLSTAIRLAENDELEQLWHKAGDLIYNLAVGGDMEVLNCAEEIDKQPETMVVLLTTLLRDVLVYQYTHRPDLLIAHENSAKYEKFKPLKGRRVLNSLARIEELRNKYKGPIRSLPLSINISFQLRDALQ